MAPPPLPKGGLTPEQAGAWVGEHLLGPAMLAVAVVVVGLLLCAAYPRAKPLIVAGVILGAVLFVLPKASALSTPAGRHPQPRPAGAGRPALAAKVAYDAGCRGRWLETAVAVAGAESRWRPRAHNPIPPDNSYGLWQVNMLGDLGPARRARLGISSNRALFDPRVNARAMYAISGGCRNWRPWTTYTSGAYRAHLATARRAVRGRA